MSLTESWTTALLKPKGSGDVSMVTTNQNLCKAQTSEAASSAVNPLAAM